MIPPLTVNGWLRFDSIKAALSRAPGRDVLEIGAGQGGMTTWLARWAGRCVAVEPDEQSRQAAAARLSSIPTAELVVEVPDESFDVVCAFEVLEHIEDDEAALLGWVDRLRQGGLIVLSVPAHQRRYAAWDRAVGHHRRYEREELVRLLHSAGLEIELMHSYGTGVGHLLERVRNLVASRELGPASTEARTARSGRWLQPRSRVSELARAVVAVPFRLLQRPFASTSRGVGWVVAARRS